jgi:hypothetical protein
MRRYVTPILALIAIMSALVMRSHATEELSTNLPLLVAQSAATTAVVAPQLNNYRCRSFAIYTTWSAGTTAGVVTVETADSDSFAGTWASLGTVNWVAANSQAITNLNGIYMSIRTRISTAVVGGTVSTRLVCN